ncbi:hypothetical protein AB0J21_31145 [Streptomyces sp. NPDC049954]|uniref:hypothetical protein n=1 Tax=Streptomyces sp. NPDC049954 TaxID=3155779 RepID=UPI003412D991
MRLRRELGKLLREAEEHERFLAELRAIGPVEDTELTYSTVVPSPSLRSFAQFAYLAEQYGYRYAGADPESGGPRTPRFQFHRLPDARDRTAGMRHRYPGAPYAGRLPGLSAWPLPRLTRPEARAEVKLLHARVVIDYSGSFRTEPMRRYLIAIPAVSLIALVVNGNELSVRNLGLTAGIAALLLALLFTSRLFLRRRGAMYRKRLERAGTPWPPT